jgi:hypothetical protein
MLLFKYLSAAGARKVLERDDALSLRFALPRTFNDPYELFLGPDTPLEEPEERAFYSFFLGEMLQAPVTCVSKRPDSVVMWAHYAQDATGICMAFEEDSFVDCFDGVFIEDVTYSDAPATVSSDVIKYAYTTGKRRHTLRLLAIANRAAYFMKRSDWQYEAERRIVVPPDAVTDRGGHLIAEISPECVQYFILGSDAPRDLQILVRKRAEAFGTSVLQLGVSRRSYAPFFVGKDSVLRWTGASFEEADQVCSTCGEPAEDVSDDGLCEWCSISHADHHSAQLRSQLVLSLKLGIDRGVPLEFDGLVPRGKNLNRR